MKISKRTCVTLQKSLLNWILPAQCILCSSKIPTNNATIHQTLVHRNSLCVFCVDSLPKIFNACSLCNTPLSSGKLCGVCINSQRHWDRCFAAFEYKDSIKQLITEFKYHKKPALGQPLGSLLYEHIINNHDKKMPDYLIPVPMHHNQLKHRGFNQSLALCKRLSSALNIPVINIIKKTTITQNQKGLSSAERKKSIKNSFQINNKALKQLENIKAVAIIDDVMTTGSTTSEIARILKKSGISTIYIWVLART